MSQARDDFAKISSKAVAVQVQALRRGMSVRSFPEIGHMLEDLAADRDRLADERDQFMEQASLRDNRDVDMQEIMRTNNELTAELAKLKSAYEIVRPLLLALEEISHFGELQATAKENDISLDLDWPARHARAALAKLVKAAM